MKFTIKNKRTLIRFVWTIIIVDLLCFACISRNQKIITKDFFLKENKDVNFSNWQGWLISYGSGKYIAVFKSDSTKEEKRLFFFQRNHVIITVLTLDDTISGGIDIDTLSNNILWKKSYKVINIEALKSHIDFVFKYNIELVCSDDKPKGINFKSFNNEFDLFYLFNPNDSVFLRNRFKYRNKNWFESK
jgi:hypothetical protein